MDMDVHLELELEDWRHTGRLLQVDMDVLKQLIE